jgi:hypothetical protein
LIILKKKKYPLPGVGIPVVPPAAKSTRLSQFPLQHQFVPRISRWRVFECGSRKEVNSAL